MHSLNEQWFKTTKSAVPSVSEHMSQHCARLCHTTPQLWQVSKSQQVYRSIPWNSFNRDTWSGLWIREEMKDHPPSKQHSWALIPSSAFKMNIWNIGDDCYNCFCRAKYRICTLFTLLLLPQSHKTVACSINQPAGRQVNCMSSHWDHFYDNNIKSARTRSHSKHKEYHSVNIYLDLKIIKNIWKITAVSKVENTTDKLI